MSHQLSVCLAAVALNLVLMSAVYACLAMQLAKSAWRGHGIAGGLLTILVGQLMWIGPALLIVGAREPESSASYALWFGNWLVCGFAVVILSRTSRTIPRGLSDAARMDGLGGFGTWRHAVLPFAGRDLALIALFTVMATLLPYWAFIALPEAGNSIVLFQRFLSPEGRIFMMLAGSLIGALPLLGIFFWAKRSQGVG
jgi:ABC-type glycerol-3-phosphate transport system permease component